MGKLTRIPDFLPPPDQLVIPEENIAVTITLTKSSFEFFKKKAEQYHTQYQKMIRELVDRYAKQYQSN